MSDDKKNQQKPPPKSQRAEGVTEAERYLSKLSNQTFLSLWSFSGVYRDQGHIAHGGDGKEICDLLVVFENHILIFSDKDCVFRDTGRLDLDWSRWYRKAVQKSAEQVYGAERWIKEHPDRLFMDRACTERFPIELPPLETAIFHRIVVAHGASRHSQQKLGGSGSLMICPAIKGDDHSLPIESGGRPFTVGVVDPTKGYVHVLDDTSLDILLKSLDTVTDFVDYLTKKEKFVLSGRLGMAAGDEELLAFYLQKVNEQQEHDFVVPSDTVSIYLDEGLWEEFLESPQRLAQLEANKVSYFWDALIESFLTHFYAGTSQYVSHPTLGEQAKLFHFPAREPRTRRRLLSESLLDLINKTPPAVKAVRVMQPSKPGDPYYVFLLLPTISGLPIEEYRTFRREYLWAYCMVTKLKFPAAQDIVGIATESGRGEYGSEDAVYLDACEWDAEQQAEAQRLHRELGLLKNVRQFQSKVYEFPVNRPATQSLFSPRRAIETKPNWPCPCGSGKKFKRCCGA